MDIKKTFDVAIIEVISWNPHIGAAYEIAIKEKKEGKSVIFIYIHNSHPEQGTNQILLEPYFVDVQKGLEYYQIPFVIFNSFQFDNLIEHTVSDLLKEFKYLTDEGILNYKISDRFIVKGIISSIITQQFDIQSSFSKYPDLFKDYLFNALRVDMSMETILNQYGFNLVYSFNGRFASSRPIFEHLKQKKIKFKTHERGARYNKYEIFDGFPHSIELTFKRIKEYQSNLLIQVFYTFYFFINQRLGRDINWTSFIKEQNNNYIKNKNEILVTYFSSSDFEFESVVELYPHSLFKSQIDAIKYITNFFKNKEGYRLVIKMHPNQKSMPAEELQMWSAFKMNNVDVLMPDSNIKTYSIMDASDLVITYASTMGMESAFWRKRVINLMHSYYTNYEKPILNEPRSIDELSCMLNDWKLIKKFPFKNFLNVGHWISTFGTTFKFYKPFNFFEGKFNYYKPYDIFKGRFTFLR